MNNNLDPLAVPSIKAVEHSDELIAIMEEQGVRRTIDSLVFPEWTYHPLTTVSLAHDDGHLYADFFVRCNYLIKRTPSCGSRPFRELEGLFAWNILVEIPLSLIGVAAESFPLEVKGNFYKCASGTSQPHFLSWIPVDGSWVENPSDKDMGIIILE